MNLIVANTFSSLASVIALGCMALVVYLLIRLRQSGRRSRELEQKFKEVENRMNTLQLETLESKLNPHLFKNILNSIQSHAYQTYYALDKLANVLDYILYDSRKKYVTPKEEVEFAINLIEINKVKLSPLFDLKIKLKIDENDPLYHQNVLAPMISIDLIENAFKHANLQGSDAFIAVTLEFSANIFSLTVANKVSDKVQTKNLKSGIGVDTMEQRLKIIYADNYKLEKFVEDNIYFAHLKINLLEHKATMLAARR